MQGKWSYIGGGAALLFAGIVASRSDLPAHLRGEAYPPAVAPAPAPMSPPAATGAATDPAPVAAGLAPDASALARLTAELTRREAENAELRTTLAVRDAVIESLNARLAGRETEADALEARLEASDAEIAALRREVAELRAQRSFEAKLAVFEAGEAEPSAARVEAVRVEAPDLEAIFDAAVEAPEGLPPLPGVETVAIHFDFASSRLTPGGQIHAAAAAVRISDLTLARVRLVGHTDRVGGPAANRRLAARRAAAVAEFLVSAGVPRDLIEIDERGEADLPVATADGVREPLNRSVEISIRPL
jgi:outer membrane protein OmpA-like peptidoglycan-associated protein